MTVVVREAMCVHAGCARALKGRNLYKCGREVRGGRERQERSDTKKRCDGGLFDTNQCVEKY